MENKEIDLVKIFKTLWQNRNQIMIWGGGGLIVGLVIAFSLPAEYTSVVRIATESKTNQSSVSSAAGMAAMMGINIGAGANSSGINEKVYPDVIKSSLFLSEFRNMEIDIDGEKMSLYKYLTTEQKEPWWGFILSLPSHIKGMFSSDKGEADGQQVYDPFRPTLMDRQFEQALSHRISMKPDSKSGILDIHVKMQNPEVAAVLADSVIYKLGQYVIEYYTSKTRNDLIQTQKVLEQAKADYYKADAAYAESADKNQDLKSKTAQIKIDRLMNEKDLAFSIYQQIASQVELTKMKLQDETPIATIIEPSRVPLTPTSPNKKLIVIAFLFLAMMIKSGVITVKYVIRSTK